MNFIEIAHAIEQAKTTIAQVEADVQQATAQLDAVKTQASKLVKDAEAVVAEAVGIYEANAKALKALYAQVQEHISGTTSAASSAGIDLKSLFLAGQKLRKP